MKRNRETAAENRDGLTVTAREEDGLLNAEAVPSEDEEAGAEAEALAVLAQWINCQGDSGEVAELMDQAERDIPEKF